MELSDNIEKRIKTFFNLYLLWMDENTNHDEAINIFLTQYPEKKDIINIAIDNILGNISAIITKKYLKEYPDLIQYIILFGIESKNDKEDSFVTNTFNTYAKQSSEVDVYLIFLLSAHKELSPNTKVKLRKLSKKKDISNILNSINFNTDCLY